MKVEVELKAPCKGAEGRVRALGAVFLKSQRQEDVYFSHPCRDFRKTDEAMRVRMADGLFLTYKGPKKRSDAKVREEIEFEVPKDALELLERLGFREAFRILKTRKTFSLDGLTICCDDVVGLGEYVEVESSSEGRTDRILEVLDRLGVKGMATTKSYSELLGA